MRRKKSVFTLLLLLLCLALLAPAALAEGEEETFSIDIIMEYTIKDSGCHVLVTPEGGESTVCESYGEWQTFTFPMGTNVTVEAVTASGWRLLNWDSAPQGAGRYSAVPSFTVTGSCPGETISFFPDFGKGTAGSRSITIGEDGFCAESAALELTIPSDYDPTTHFSHVHLVNNAPSGDLYFAPGDTTLSGAQSEAFSISPLTDVLRSGWSSAMLVQPSEGLAPGTYTAAVEIKDRDDLLTGPLSVSLTLRVIDLALSSETAAALHEGALPCAIEGKPWSFTFSGGGGLSTDAWALPGTLPEGLAFTDNGDGTATIAGTPAAGTAFDGWYYLELEQKHTGEGAASIRRGFSLRIYPDTPPRLYVTEDGYMSGGSCPVYTDTALPDAYPGVYYSPAIYLDTLASGESPYGEQILFEPVEGKAFPDALINERLAMSPMSFDGYLEPGDYAFTAQSVRMDSDGETVLAASEKRLFTLHCVAWPRLKEDGFLKSESGSLYAPMATVGEPYSFTFAAESEIPVSIALSEGWELPEGLSLNDNGDGTATISGTVDTVLYGSSTELTLRTAAGENTEYIDIVSSEPAGISVECRGEIFSAAELPAMAVGADCPYTMIRASEAGSMLTEFSVSGETPSFFVQAAPNWAALTGIAAEEDQGTWALTVTLTVRNVDGTVFDTASRTLAFTVYPAIDSEYTWSDEKKIEIPLLQRGTEMEPVALAPYVSGGTGSVSYAVYDGHADEWPAGLTLDKQTGVISGAPTEIRDPTRLIVQATDTLTGQTVDLGLSFAGVRDSAPAKTPEDYVERAYSVILSREADEAGLAHWTAELSSGASAGAIIAEFFKSAEYLSRGLSTEETVTLCYQAMLSRDPDAEGLSNWTALLNDGYSTTKLVSEFIGSDEFRAICESYGLTAGSIALSERDLNGNVTRFIERCYTYALERAADEGGLNLWCGHLNNGHMNELGEPYTPERVAFGFVFSDESKAMARSDTDFIAMLYRLMLDREPDADGLANWVSALEKNTAAEIAYDAAFETGRSEADAIDQTRQNIYALFAASEEFALMCSNFGL